MMKSAAALTGAGTRARHGINDKPARALYLL